MNPGVNDGQSMVVAGRRDPLRMLSRLELPLTVCFGRARMSLKEVLSLTPGSTVELDSELHDLVEVRVNNRLVARGELVVVDGCYGVRLTELIDEGPIV